MYSVLRAAVVETAVASLETDTAGLLRPVSNGLSDGVSASSCRASLESCAIRLAKKK
jgi:hypothetical protein